MVLAKVTCLGLGFCLERGLNHRDMRILREDSDDVFSTLLAARIVLKSVIGELTVSRAGS